MSRRFLFVAVFMLSLPLFGTTVNTRDHSSATPYATVVFAGHTQSGYWCECGSAGCTCDPGEVPPRSATTEPSEGEAAGSSGQDATSNENSDLDYGSGALVLALFLLMWLRMRT